MVVIEMPPRRGREPNRQKQVARSRVLHGLVIAGTVQTRQLALRAGRRAAGPESQWLSTPDAENVATLLRARDLDVVVTDEAGFDAVLQGNSRSQAGHGEGSRYRLAVMVRTQDADRLQGMIEAGAECCLAASLPDDVLETALAEWISDVASKR